MWGHHDMGTWDPMTASAITMLVSDYGYDITVTWAEEVAQVDAPDIGRLLARESDLVYWTTCWYMDAIIQVGNEYPDVPFVTEENWYIELVPGVDNYPPNVSAWDCGDAFLEGGYMIGAMAALMYQQGVIPTPKFGIVSAWQSPTTNAMANAYTWGAQTLVPEFEIQFTFIGAISDPPKARDAVAAFVEQGFHFIQNSLDDEAVLQECKDRGILCSTWYVDLRLVFPSVLAADMILWPHLYMKDAVDAVLNDTWREWWAENRVVTTSVATGHAEVLFGTMVPQTVLDPFSNYASSNNISNNHHSIPTDNHRTGL
jgi:basic membrane lipoprotein Med (substrate-binding protein (PBP1-ABC) superfamily)